MAQLDASQLAPSFLDALRPHRQLAQHSLRLHTQYSHSTTTPSAIAGKRMRTAAGSPFCCSCHCLDAAREAGESAWRDCGRDYRFGRWEVALSVDSGLYHGQLKFELFEQEAALQYERTE
jgi:hypothetical protein